MGRLKPNAAYFLPKLRIPPKLWGGPPGPRGSSWTRFSPMKSASSTLRRADGGVVPSGDPRTGGSAPQSMQTVRYWEKYVALANPGCGVPSGPLSAGGCRMRRLAHGPKEPPERRPQRGPQDKIARPTTNTECRDGQSEWQPPPRNRPGRPTSCNFGRLPSDRPHPFTPLAPTSLAGLRFRLRSPDFPDWAVDCSGSAVRRAVTPV